MSVVNIRIPIWPPGVFCYKIHIFGHIFGTERHRGTKSSSTDAFCQAANLGFQIILLQFQCHFWVFFWHFANLRHIWPYLRNRESQRHQIKFNRSAVTRCTFWLPKIHSYNFQNGRNRQIWANYIKNRVQT